MSAVNRHASSLVPTPPHTPSPARSRRGSMALPAASSSGAAGAAVGAGPPSPASAALNSSAVLTGASEAHATFHKSIFIRRTMKEERTKQRQMMQPAEEGGEAAASSSPLLQPQLSHTSKADSTPASHSSADDSLPHMDWHTNMVAASASPASAAASPSFATNVDGSVSPATFMLAGGSHAASRVSSTSGSPLQSYTTLMSKDASAAAPAASGGYSAGGSGGFAPRRPALPPLQHTPRSTHRGGGASLGGSAHLTGGGPRSATLMHSSPSMSPDGESATTSFSVPAEYPAEIALTVSTPLSGSFHRRASQPKVEHSATAAAATEVVAAAAARSSPSPPPPVAAPATSGASSLMRAFSFQLPALRSTSASIGGGGSGSNSNGNSHRASVEVRSGASSPKSAALTPQLRTSPPKSHPLPHLMPSMQLQQLSEEHGDEATSAGGSTSNNKQTVASSLLSPHHQRAGSKSAPRYLAALSAPGTHTHSRVPSSSSLLFPHPPTSTSSVTSPMASSRDLLFRSSSPNGMGMIRSESPPYPRAAAAAAAVHTSLQSLLDPTTTAEPETVDLQSQILMAMLKRQHTEQPRESAKQPTQQQQPHPQMHQQRQQPQSQLQPQQPLPHPPRADSPFSGPISADSASPSASRRSSHSFSAPPLSRRSLDSLAGAVDDESRPRSPADWNDPQYAHSDDSPPVSGIDLKAAAAAHLAHPSPDSVFSPRPHHSPQSSQSFEIQVAEPQSLGPKPWEGAVKHTNAHVPHSFSASSPAIPLSQRRHFFHSADLPSPGVQADHSDEFGAEVGAIGVHTPLTAAALAAANPPRSDSQQRRRRRDTGSMVDLQGVNAQQLLQQAQMHSKPNLLVATSPTTASPPAVASPLTTPSPTLSADGKRSIHGPKHTGGGSVTSESPSPIAGPIGGGGGNNHNHGLNSPMSPATAQAVLVASALPAHLQPKLKRIPLGLGSTASGSVTVRSSFDSPRSEVCSESGVHGTESSVTSSRASYTSTFGTPSLLASTGGLNHWRGSAGSDLHHLGHGTSGSGSNHIGFQSPFDSPRQFTGGSPSPAMHTFTLGTGLGIKQTPPTVVRGGLHLNRMHQRTFSTASNEDAEGNINHAHLQTQQPEETTHTNTQ